MFHGTRAFSRRMRWAGHVASMWDKRGLYRVLMGTVRERDHLEDPGVDGMIILIWIFTHWDTRAWTGPSWLRIGTDSGRLFMR